MYQVSYNVYVETEGCKYVDEFNPAFIQAWKTTSNYAKWLERPHPAVLELHPGHMFSGQLSMSDVKLKITQITQYASDFHRFLWKRFTNLLLFFFLKPEQCKIRKKDVRSPMLLPVPVGQ